MERQDERTNEQMKTHTVLIGGTDSFMSGWGKAENGNSYAFWACKPKDSQAVWRWVNNRSEFKRVRKVYDPYYPNPNYCEHLHIYVVEDGHPSLIF